MVFWSISGADFANISAELISDLAETFIVKDDQILAVFKLPFIQANIVIQAA